MSTQARTRGTFTGRHMLAIMLAFFGVVVGVNVTMAMFAGSSWTGFVVRNSYVASQEFNEKVAAARAQDALGWKAELAIAGGTAELRLYGRDGQPVVMDHAVIVMRNPASDADDRTIQLTSNGAAMSARLDIRDGLWVVEIDIDVAGHKGWRDTRRVRIVSGAIR